VYHAIYNVLVSQGHLLRVSLSQDNPVEVCTAHKTALFLQSHCCSLAIIDRVIFILIKSCELNSHFLRENAGLSPAIGDLEGRESLPGKTEHLHCLEQLNMVDLSGVSMGVRPQNHSNEKSGCVPLFEGGDDPCIKQLYV